MRARSLTQTEGKTHMPQKTQRMVNLPPNIISIQAFPLYFKCWTYVPLLFDIKKQSKLPDKLFPVFLKGSYMNWRGGEGIGIIYSDVFPETFLLLFFSGLKPFDTHRGFSNTLYDGCKLSYRML